MSIRAMAAMCLIAIPSLFAAANAQLKETIEIVDYNEINHRSYISDTFKRDIGTKQQPGPCILSRMFVTCNIEHTYDEILAMNLAHVFSDQIFVMEDNGLPVGFVCIYASTEEQEKQFGDWRIRILHVDAADSADAVERKVALFNHALHSIRTNFPSASVWLMVKKFNTKEQERLEKSGFKRVGEKISCYVYAYLA